MGRIFYETKRIIAMLLITLVLSIIIAPISEAAFTNNMKKGDKYKYTGNLLIVYRDKEGAKRSNIFKIRKTLSKGAEITIEEVDGNIIKIGNNQYIKCTILNIRKFSKLLDEVVEQEPTPEPEPIPEPKPEPTPTTTAKPEKISVTKVSLDKTKVTLNKGKTLQLKAKVEPNNATNKTVTWKSSNSKVATVSTSGKVTAKGKGTATITATADGKSATCTITVEVPVTKVSLDKTKVTLNNGETLQLKAKVEPNNATNKTVTWKSSNSKVATVSNGKIKAKAIGTATITVTAKDGSGKKAVCTVTVKQPVTGIVLNKTESELNIGETLTLKATVKPNNATNKSVTWKSSNNKVATVSNGKIKAVAEGKAKITVTAKDGSGKTEICIVKVVDPYKYTFRNNTYKIAVTKDRLDSVLNTINKKGIYQNNGWERGKSFTDPNYTNGKCYRIAICHLDMLLHKNVEKNITHSGYGKGSYSYYYQFDSSRYTSYVWNNKDSVKKCIDAGKPVSVHTYTSYGEHWAVAVGYKGNGSSMNDLLFISCTNGVLCLNGERDVNGLHSNGKFLTIN